MSWSKDPNVTGNIICTQFTNTVQDELNPQTAYQTTPFINDNTTLTQEISFAYFDNLLKTQSINTKLFSPSSTSNLPVTLTSSNNDVATISGNTLTALTTGNIYITATQDGDGTYDPATPVICVFNINIEYTQVGPSGKIEYPIEVSTYTSKQNIASFIITINDIKYTNYSGISYGFATGFHGSAMIGSINCFDGNGSNVTDFSDIPINLTVSMANANTSHSYSVYKRNGSVLFDPQPVGYPVSLTYVSGTNWTGTLTQLSDIIILDENPPAGNAGGDPYIVSVKKIKTLLPNEWKTVRLLETDTISIIANCEFLDKKIMSNLHYINKSKQRCIQIDPSKHKWVKDLTYITTLDLIDKNTNKKLVMDTLQGNIIQDNSSFLYELLSHSRYGLYSITHHGHYPKAAFKKYIIHFDEGYIVVSIDNYWDDINFIELFLHDKNYNLYTGELIEHDENNNITDV